MPLADIRPALRAFLLGDPDVSAAISSERIYPIVLPQGQRAASIVYTRISAIGDHTMEGASGLAQVRMQIDSYAQTQGDADELARLVKLRLDGFQGLMGSVEVQGCYFDTIRDDYQSEPELFRVSQDFFIVFEER